MSFSKTIIVLKELENDFALNGKKISGIVRIEQTDGISELYLSTINLRSVSGGAFYLFVIDSTKTVYAFDLGLSPYSHGKLFQGQPIIDKGVLAGLCFVKDDLPITIAFGASENASANLTDFKRLIADTCYNLRRKAQKEKEELIEREQFISQQAQPKTTIEQYDDEAVATENFYALTDSIKDSLTKIKENQDARLRTENAMPFDNHEKETEKIQPQTYCSKDETDYLESKKYSAQNPYYLTVKEELDQVFNNFAPEKKLCALFADSRWAKVTYSKDKYYVVGVVKECEKEKYICYGVPEKYSLEPPKALKGCATFIPLSIFDLKGDGYWMMFQDAVTGDCIRLKKV